MVILFAVILLLVTIFLVHRILRKRCSRPANPPRMPREDAIEDQEIREDLLVIDHTELLGEGSQLNNESSQLRQQVGSAEPSGACAADEDSSVRVSFISTVFSRVNAGPRINAEYKRGDCK